MKRPIWLFSMDTEQFSSPPLVTGGLVAYFLERGATADGTEIELVHFRQSEDIAEWVRRSWHGAARETAVRALQAGQAPLLGFSCYTWNVAAFLELIGTLRADVPELTVVVGGPHVQEAEEFLVSDGIDAVVLGEGESTFCELADAADRAQWAGIGGLAYRDHTGRLHRTPPRARRVDLSDLPSALDVIELRDAAGQPRYPRAAIETSRGCPFRCAFCEWGTGAIGTKMYQFPLERFRDEVERLIAGGVDDIWLCDSNFGALPEDLEKARILVDVRRRTGRPSTFATSWHKQHNARVREIVLLLHESGMLQHYNLALQTLTPLALELSHRKNLRSNQYEPIAKDMAEAGVSVATELIWGLPGDTLHEFEQHLDRLSAVFPNINIFGYTLLPGTEFYARRNEYQIDAIPVAGYGRAHGEYVVGCQSFDRDEGIEGYYLISAHILLVRGYVIPFTARYLALGGGFAVSAFLRATLRALAAEFAADLPALDLTDRMTVYENRAALYVAALRDEERAFRTIAAVLDASLRAAGITGERARHAHQVLELDRAFCPKAGPGGIRETSFDFDAVTASHFLGRMELPSPECFATVETSIAIRHVGHVGEVLVDPDGGSWMRGIAVESSGEAAGTGPETGLSASAHP
jgi:tRNA A37 methylthiotransferase MiaB